MLEDEQIAGLLIFPLALTGVVANWTVALLIRKLPSLSNSFGRLTASQSIGDAMQSTIFFFYFCPMCFFGLESFKSHSWAVGHLLIIVYDISTYSHLCISLNRFCSIVAPVKYDSIFSMKNTNILLSVCWGFAILSSFYFYVYNDCTFFFLEEFWVFVYSTTPVCNIISWYAGFLKFNSIVLSIVIIDIITVFKVRSFKAKLARTTSQAQKRRETSEISFLKQACLQAFVFTCELATYFLISPKIDPDQKFLKFGLSTVAWVSVHMLDGIITIACNKEFHQVIFGKIKIESSSTTQSINGGIGSK